MNTSIRNLFFATAMLLATTGLAHASSDLDCLEALLSQTKQNVAALERASAPIKQGRWCAAHKTYAEMTRRLVTGPYHDLCSGRGIEQYAQVLDRTTEYLHFEGTLLRRCYN